MTFNEPLNLFTPIDLETEQRINFTSEQSTTGLSKPTEEKRWRRPWLNIPRRCSDKQARFVTACPAVGVCGGGGGGAGVGRPRALHEICGRLFRQRCCIDKVTKLLVKFVESNCDFTVHHYSFLNPDHLATCSQLTCCAKSVFPPSLIESGQVYRNHNRNLRISSWAVTFS